MTQLFVWAKLYDLFVVFPISKPVASWLAIFKRVNQYDSLYLNICDWALEPFTLFVLSRRVLTATGCVQSSFEGGHGLVDINILFPVALIRQSGHTFTCGGVLEFSLLTVPAILGSFDYFRRHKIDRVLLSYITLLHNWMFYYFPSFCLFIIFLLYLSFLRFDLFSAKQFFHLLPI